MQLIRSIERQYMQYMNTLQSAMKPIPEYVDVELGSSLRKPSDIIFENSRRIIRLLCALYGNQTHVASKFCVTVDGEFQIILSDNGTSGRVTIGESGIQMFNWYNKTRKYVSLSYTDKQITDQYKKYMKNYI